MNDPNDIQPQYNLQPFRRAVFRGFGVILPPLLTVVILLWIANSVQKFVLTPVEWASRQGIVWLMNDADSAAIEIAANLKVRDDQEKNAQQRSDEDPTDPQSQLTRLAQAVDRIEQKLGSQNSEVSQVQSRRAARRFEYEDEVYVRLENGEWIPSYIREQVLDQVAVSGVELENTSSTGYYNYYVEHRVLRKAVVIPVFFAGFILLMYLLGKFLAAGVGRILWKSMEGIIAQLPIIRTVYNSVKQVTDFFVGESDIDFQRVVAVEYPRKGMWSVGFVTGESLLSIRGAVQDPVVSVLMPTSPVPGTGFTVTVAKSETIDLDIPIEQALQFVVSCGVVVPEGQMQEQQLKELLETAAGPELLESNSGN